MAKVKRDHSAIALQYAHDVIAGTIPACRFVKLACQRHLDDLANDSVLWPYKFDPAKANRFCTFAELFKHVKGPLARQFFVLEPWQCFIFCNLFGWVLKTTGKRRFRKAHVEVPRGSGKSFAVSVITLYMLSADGEAGAELFSAANTREQARIVLDVAREMAKNCPKYLEKYGVVVAANDIHLINDTLSVFKSLASEADSLDGKNPHLVIFDEIQAHKTRTLYEVMETALGKRDNNLMMSIGTAGFDRYGIGYEVRGRVIEMLDKVYPDETFFGIIYTIDEDDDWTTEESLQKANPNFGISVIADTIREDHRRAIFTTHKQASFQMKHMDIWTNASTALISARDWQACYTPHMDIEDFRKDRCEIGLDLASEQDLTAMMKLFIRNEEGKQHVYVFGKYWLPDKAIEESSNAKYEGWARDEYITRCEKASVDFDQVEQYVKETAGAFDVKHIVYDPWQAKQMVDHLMANGAPMVLIKPFKENFSPALKTLLTLIADKRIHHNGDPVLAWCMSNVIGVYGPNDSIMPEKERYENKIDAVVAILMALCMVKVEKAPVFWTVSSK